MPWIDGDKSNKSRYDPHWISGSVLHKLEQAKNYRKEVSQERERWLQAGCKEQAKDCLQEFRAWDLVCKWLAGENNIQFSKELSKLCDRCFLLLDN